MKHLTCFTIIIVVFSIAGCVRSAQPLFTKKDLVFKGALIGTWTDKDGNDIWRFQKSQDSGYTLIYYQRKYSKSNENQSGDTCRFEAHLIQLGQYYFLDLFPEEPGSKIKNDFYIFHLMRVHTFHRIWFDGDLLRTAMLNDDWLNNMLDKQNIDIAHEKVDGHIILTAPTKELQLLVLRYAEDNWAFPEPKEYHRLK